MKYSSREVKVGNIGVGSSNPVRIQSMTTTSTRDAKATADQIIQLADAGCEIARVTVQGMKEALACEIIKSILTQKGYTIPLVADIHFYPPAAMTVADFVDKVRINPGNFVDKRATFKTLTYDEGTYAEELQKIEDKFTPLVLKCKERGIAMRIGANHGSLSDRIMNRFGDTPLGMVESALEFTRVARAHDYHDLIFSMKASNPLVMIAAYRLLVARLDELGWDYPIHLGVTEAGAGEDGRIKSAVGIGSLLLDGIGDTIRVSLTEDPCAEIAPAKYLARLKRPTPRLYHPPEKRTIHTPPSLHPQGSVLLPGDPLPASDEALLFNPTQGRITATREKAKQLKESNINKPLLLNFAYDCPEEELILRASAECGTLLADGLAQGLALSGPYPHDTLSSLSFGILQACRMRLTKTEFISCPGCGRTLFDLQEVSKRIRAQTGHLPGLKIAIMGCIVNGPGEMADADFGYVGSAKGKIDLYVGKTCVEKNIPSQDAENKLIELIKQHGQWLN